MDSFHEMLDRDQRSEEEYEQHLIDYWDAKYDAEYEAAEDYYARRSRRIQSEG